MTKEEITAHEGATTFETLKGPLLGIYEGRLSVQMRNKSAIADIAHRVAGCPNEGGLGEGLSTYGIAHVGFDVHFG